MSQRNDYPAVFGLILINLLIYVLDHVLGIRSMQALYLNFNNWHIWQLFTMSICHGSWMHLSGNVFFIYVFGRLVEEEEGSGGLIAAYFITGFGAAVISLLFTRGVGYSVGASGAVFGLFVVGTFVKFRWHWKSLLETLILGQFTLMHVLSEVGNAGKQTGIDHWAHLGGALTGGVVMIWGARVMRRISTVEQEIKTVLKR